VNFRDHQPPRTVGASRLFGIKPIRRSCTSSRLGRPQGGIRTTGHDSQHSTRGWLSRSPKFGHPSHLLQQRAVDVAVCIVGDWRAHVHWRTLLHQHRSRVDATCGTAQMPRSVQPLKLTSPARSKTGCMSLPCTPSTHVRESYQHMDQACRVPSTHLPGRDLSCCDIPPSSAWIQGPTWLATGAAAVTFLAILPCSDRITQEGAQSSPAQAGLKRTEERPMRSPGRNASAPAKDPAEKASCSWTHHVHVHSS
jgi:hypothetical protein